MPIYSYVLYRTPWGVHLRSVGEDEAAAEAAGIRVTRTKFVSILMSGVLCGIAGAQLAMATLGSFTAGMTSGRGFIAVAALTFGLARPVRTMIAAFIFGAADAVADQLGVAGVNSNLALMTPYIITILALVLVGVRVRRSATARRPADPRLRCRAGPGRRMSTKIVLDCDPGHDDAIALLLAAGDPRIELLAVTTVAGNQTLEKVTRNALAVATIAGIDVPIAAGADRPLVRPQIVAPEIHGESGLDGPVLPEPSVALTPGTVSTCWSRP